MELTRRVVLSLAGLAALGVVIPACRKMLGQILFSPKAAQVPPPPLAGNPFKNASKSLVALVHGTDVAAMVQHATALIGGLGKLQLAGTRTLLKPNVVGGAAPPITTDPRVVQVLGALVRAEKPASLVVGEMSAVMALPTRPHLERTGMVQAAGALGADVIAFDEEEWVEVRLPHVEHTTTVYVAKAAYEAHRLISVPVIKTHRHASFSCALKNTVGCVHGKNKPWMYGSGWEAAVAELNLAVHPHLYVIGGLQSLAHGGPWAGEGGPTQIVLASGDRIATDVVALGLLKAFGRWGPVTTRGVWEQVQIQRAIAPELGARAGRGGARGPGSHRWRARVRGAGRRHQTACWPCIGMTPSGEGSVAVSRQIFDLTGRSGQITILSPQVVALDRHQNRRGECHVV